MPVGFKGKRRKVGACFPTSMAINKIVRHGASLIFMSKEIFDIVNERNEVVGQNTRRDLIYSATAIV